jgi:DNA-binding NarL/FixJ family response regulator
VKIVIVEDHLMFREVLRKVCVDEMQHEVVAESGDGVEAIELIRRLEPDLVLLDLHLPSVDGFSVMTEVRKNARRSRILVLSSHCDEYTVFRVEQARVDGFVDKNTNTIATLKAAITAVAAGQSWYSPAFQREKNARRQNPSAVDKLLTTRERAILGLIGQPMTDAEISEQLDISMETVEKHRFNLLRKLGFEKTSELARYARDHGFAFNSKPAADRALLP